MRSIELASRADPNVLSVGPEADGSGLTIARNVCPQHTDDHAVAALRPPVRTKIPNGGWRTRLGAIGSGYQFWQSVQCGFQELLAS
jgi:hypothetical protein